MRIVVPVVSSAHAISGVPRHAINMVQSLLLSDRVEHIHVVAGDWQHYVPALLQESPKLSLEMVSLRNDIVSRNIWYSRRLPRVARQQRADLVHYSFPAPMRPRAMNAPVVVTLHDLYPYDLPENFGMVKAPFNRMILRRSLESASAIACVSRSTLDRLDRINPLLALRSAHVIPNCVEPFVGKAKRPTCLQEHDAFVLCVAQHRRNKNLLMLLRAYVCLLGLIGDCQFLRLVIVGMDGPETKELKSFINEHRLQQHVLLLSGLPEEELRWCYQQCLALVAPSIVEGFGLPIVEGLMQGCRVVCSDIPVFREVGGTHCTFVRLDGDAEIRFAYALAKVFSKPKTRAISLPEYSRIAISGQYERLYLSLTQRNKMQMLVREPVLSEQMKEQVHG